MASYTDQMQNMHLYKCVHVYFSYVAHTTYAAIMATYGLDDHGLCGAQQFHPARSALLYDLAGTEKCTPRHVWNPDRVRING